MVVCGICWSLFLLLVPTTDGWVDIIIFFVVSFFEGSPRKHWRDSISLDSMDRGRESPHCPVGDAYATHVDGKSREPCFTRRYTEQQALKKKRERQDPPSQKCRRELMIIGLHGHPHAESLTGTTHRPSGTSLQLDWLWVTWSRELCHVLWCAVPNIPNAPGLRAVKREPVGERLSLLLLMYFGIGPCGVHGSLIITIVSFFLFFKKIIWLFLRNTDVISFYGPDSYHFIAL